MKAHSTRWRNIRFLGLVMLAVTLVPIGVLGSYNWESVNISVEVKEPLEILDYPSSFSLYPGENATFEITIQNKAPNSYFVMLDFCLNDTKYQAKYVTFSNYNYTVAPGTQELTAWLTVAPTAPPANFILEITLVRDIESDETPSVFPEPYSSSTLSPSMELLSGGARWAAREGKTALYINWKDNWATHHLTDGTDWQWGFPEAEMDYWDTSILVALDHAGFEVTRVGDFLGNWSDYDLVVVFAYYAVEPQHEPLIRDYVFNGGSIVLFAAAPCYLTANSKTLSTYSTGFEDSSGSQFRSIQEWFGCSGYANGGGNATPICDNPLGTKLSTKDALFTEIPGHFGYAGVTSLNEDSQIIALWSTGLVYAFTHEYGDGRVYYQSRVGQLD